MASSEKSFRFEMRIEQRGHHQVRRPLLIDENTEMEILRLANLLSAVEGADMHGHRNHLRSGAQFAFDRAMPVLPQRADHFGGVAHFGGLIRRGQRRDDVFFGNRHIDRPEIEHRMPESQHALAVVVSNRAPPVMVISPDTSTAATLSPGCIEVAQSAAGLSLN